MPTREAIVQAADALFYERGFEHTSFADIAQAVQISRGNFYYHFRTKDEILEAVIAARLAQTRAMLAQWEAQGHDPAQRVCLFIEILVRNQARIMQFGCPAGSLCMELGKLRHPSQPGAHAILALFQGWLRGQLVQLGREQDADALALRLLAMTQGIAVLAQAMGDATLIQREVDLMTRWVRSLAPSSPQPI